MTFYRPLVAALAAFIIASPVFADDTTMQTTTTTTNETTQSVTTQVNINTSSVKSLMKVKGINASKARAIVAYRKKHGSFKSLDVLAKVKGFTKMKSDDLKAIQDQLTM
jgi:competence protein ComEA